MPRKTKSKRVTLADVVREFGPVGGAKKMSPKRAHVAGAALRDMFPALTASASSSLANHMYQANLSRQREGADAGGSKCCKPGTPRSRERKNAASNAPHAVYGNAA